MAEDYRHFNLDTMSGVFPGTRTMVFQRLRLSLATGGATAPRWARLQWYTTPAACVLSIPAELAFPGRREKVWLRRAAGWPRRVASLQMAASLRAAVGIQR